MINSPERSPLEAGTPPHCHEDPFMTLLSYKACIMGWRVVRLMALGIEHINTRASVGEVPVTASISISLASVVLSRLMKAINPDDTDTVAAPVSGTTSDTRYLCWAASAFELRNTWPSGSWMVTGFQEVMWETA